MHCLSVGSQRVLVFLAWLLLCGVPMHAQDAATVCTVSSAANEGEGTLRELVARADCDIIDFHPFIAEIQLESAVDILRKVTMAGPGADLLTIRAGAAGVSRYVFGVTAGHSVAISGITLTGGTGGRGGSGGAITTSGALTLERVTIAGNSVVESGGGIENFGILTLDGVTISGNSAARGGGITNRGTVIVNNSTISGNSGSDGSAINSDGNVILRNSTVSGNSGFIAILSRDMTVTNSTVARNLGHGNALQVSGSLTIKNAIVAANERGLDSNCTAGTLVNLGGNLSDDASCGFTQVALEDLALGPLADHGGPTQTHALGPNSVAIDSAECTDAAGGPVIADQRGVARPQGSACDAGAFERRVLAITTESLPNAMVGQPYSVTLQFSGETSLVTWSIAAGELPAGLALDGSTGEISGTPTADGDFLFTARAQAAADAGETAIRSLTIAVLGNLELLTEQLDGGVVGDPYAVTLAATGQAEPYIWGVISGALPPGLILDPLTGNLTGLPTEGGDFHFRMNVTTVVAGFISTVSRNLTVTITGGNAKTISDILAAAYGAIADGSLVGEGPGNSAPGRLHAWLEVLHGAKEMLDAGDVAGACGQLAQAYLRADGEPEDFVTGPAAPALADMIAGLRLSLGCS